MSLLQSFNLTQTINEPTRLGNTGATLLDLIVCSDSSRVLNSYVDPSLDVSDHFLIKCELKVFISKPKPYVVSYRDFKNFNREDFFRELLNAPFQDILYIQDINIKMSVFSALIVSLFDSYAPVRTARITKKKRHLGSHKI